MSDATAISALRACVLGAARAWLGTPYANQASVKGVGCDCLGLVRGVYREVIGPEPEEPPPYTPDWGEGSGSTLQVGEPLLAAAMRHFSPVALKAAQPGDLIVFRWRPDLPAKHVAILSAPDRIIHAYDGAGVVETALGRHWGGRAVAAFAFQRLG